MMIIFSNVIIIVMIIQDMPVVDWGSFVVVIVTGNVFTLVGTAAQLH